MAFTLSVPPTLPISGLSRHLIQHEPRTLDDDPDLTTCLISATSLASSSSEASLAIPGLGANRGQQTSRQLAGMTRNFLDPPTLQVKAPSSPVIAAVLPASPGYRNRSPNSSKSSSSSCSSSSSSSPLSSTSCLLPNLTPRQPRLRPGDSYSRGTEDRASESEPNHLGAKPPLGRSQNTRPTGCPDVEMPRSATACSPCSLSLTQENEHGSCPETEPNRLETQWRETSRLLNTGLLQSSADIGEIVFLMSSLPILNEP
ncbi:unnamed protein product [Protopolystoma xenopodis]|uniref:Uncharacterized protein n=1 Tax=Protopolystoma xenopodis TaxID=117903 RepID=A0A3S5CGD6_9PLAT|nr:unnamed protein product [Protopolystoma xenopodis]